MTDFFQKNDKSHKELSNFLISSLNDATKFVRERCEIFKLDHIESITESFYSGVYYDVSLKPIFVYKD